MLFWLPSSVSSTVVQRAVRVRQEPWRWWDRATPSLERPFGLQHPSPPAPTTTTLAWGADRPKPTRCSRLCPIPTSRVPLWCLLFHPPTATTLSQSMDRITSTDQAPSASPWAPPGEPSHQGNDAHTNAAVSKITLLANITLYWRLHVQKLGKDPFFESSGSLF